MFVFKFLFISGVVDYLLHVFFDDGHIIEIMDEEKNVEEDLYTIRVF